MKKDLKIIEHFARLGVSLRETPFLDDVEKLDLMCEYFEIVLDCLEGRLPADKRISIVGDYDDEQEEQEDSWGVGVSCGCGGNCLCGEES